MSDDPLSELRRIKHEHPHMRVGQILTNALGRRDPDLFYMEDDELAGVLEACPPFTGRRCRSQKQGGKGD